ncbi:MAG: tRNA (adenosine(37)-N6)-threonylcarbamoyltransferase complex transferase subunit TsaD [Opitutales bacterium]|nr:tRNA (adenosine(37)-N6)-threonylcarbamoyltransferase complex transferase subunit TsaD [Opitutales bacterium]
MILAVESSCDESALALWDPRQGVVNEWVHSQIAIHSEYGGIVPDLASREHLQNFPWLLKTCMEQAPASSLNAIAVTCGPGLAGCLALGISMAKALAFALEKPLVGVNHLRGHAWSPFIPVHGQDPDAFVSTLETALPHLGLIVSGGNTVLFSIDRKRNLRIEAQTIDDAAGEALDKGAKLLGLPYPGGPLIEKQGALGNPKAFDFPRAFANNRQQRFSFSGLKTSLRYTLEKLADAELESAFADICASYQQAVVDALVLKTRQVLQGGGWRSLGLSGGVANNSVLREAFQQLGKSQRLPVHIAEPRHTGDNATMIAFASWVDPAGCHDLNAKGLPGFQPALPLTSY